MNSLGLYSFEHCRWRTDSLDEKKYSSVLLHIQASEQIGADAIHSGNNGAESSGTKRPPSKKQRVYTEIDYFVMIMSQNFGELSSTIKKACLTT